MVFQSEIIGQSISRIDGPDKVTGETLYTADVVLPGMLMHFSTFLGIPWVGLASRT